jgi:hypothetical protein
MTPMAEIESDGTFVTAIAVGEVRNLTERADFNALVSLVGRHGRVQPLADGLITACLIRVPLRAVPLLTTIHVTLRNDFVYGQVVMPVQETVIQVLKDLAADTRGEFFPIHTCSICAALAPFPATVFVRGEDGKRRVTDTVYCDPCAKSISDSPSEPAAVCAPAAAEVIAVAA